MRVMIDLCVVPLGVGVSVRSQVKRAHQIIADTGLVTQLHSYGTNVEGELSQIFLAVQRVHETLHNEGVVRLSTAIKVGTRSDKEPTLAGKLFASSAE